MISSHSQSEYFPRLRLLAFKSWNSNPLLRSQILQNVVVTVFLFYIAASASGLETGLDSPPSRTETFKTTGSLRGFGALDAKGRIWNQTPGRERAVVEIECEDAARANATASKYVADLLAYGAVKRVDLPGIGATGIDVENGGHWAVGMDGVSVIIAQATQVDDLQKLLKKLGAEAWSKPDGHYPRYLDNFDNSSLSIWCASNTKSPSGIDFMKRNHLVVRLDASAGSPSQSYAPGVVDESGIRNVKALANVLGTGYKFSGCVGRGNVLPKWFQRGGWPFVGESLPAFTEPRGDFDYYLGHFQSPEGRLVLQDSYLQILRSLVDDPDLLEWMEPHGERTFRLWRRPPDWKENYPKFLREKKGYSLAEVSTRHTGKPDAYKSWNEVPYPELAEFYGRRGNFFDLDATSWRWRTDDHKQLAGIEAGWWKADFDDSSWGNDFRWNSRINGNKGRITSSPGTQDYIWYRFSDQGQTQLLNSKKVWLHIMPFSGRRPLSPISIWINGKPVVRDFADKLQGPLIKHMKFDVTAFLKDAPNQFALLYQDSIHYRVWLSDRDDAGYPTDDANLNRKWVDWIAYLMDEELSNLESYLRLIRSVDPNRPIKIMAADKGMLPQVLDLCERYGAFMHLTGENPRQYRPEDYKYFSAIRGLPSTSEPGSPLKTAADIQAMFANIFWESQDSHDYGFDLDRTVMTQPPVVAWFDQNRTLLSTLAKTSLGAPQLGILFDAGQGSLYNRGDAYNWNPGRGLLSQGNGFRYAFLSAHDLAKGLGKSLPVIIDSATRVMTPKTVSAIRDYVTNGGTFVAMHLSGVDSEEKTETWPLLQEFGFRVRSAPGKLPLKFTSEQELFPELKGKVIKQRGVSIDYLGRSETGNVAALPVDETDMTPIAHWQDGSIAIAERRIGKGRFLFFGAPVYFHARDTEGKWYGQNEQQTLLQTMLHQLGVDPQTGSSDPAVWTDWRESKNGLYQVLLAARMVSPDGDAPASTPVDLWYLPHGLAPGNAVELTAASQPSLPPLLPGGGSGQYRLQGLGMEPKKIRQFAFVRQDVGLEGPLHWLKMQADFWRAIEPVSPDVARQVAEQFAAKYPRSQAKDISFDWKVQLNPDVDPAWTNPEFPDEAWPPGSLGAWFERGWQDKTVVRYRQRISIPDEWKDKRIILGFEPGDAMFDRGATPTGKTPDGRFVIGSSLDYQEIISARPEMKLWAEGKKILSRDNYHAWKFDVTDRVKAGQMALAFEVTGTSLCRGPSGTMYLWAVPYPSAALPLDDSWKKITSWWRSSSEKAVMGKSDQSIGWSTQVTIPEAWKGGQVYLVVESSDSLLKSQYADSIYTIVVNGSAQSADYLLAPIGQRLDGSLKPGEENTIEIIFPKGGGVHPTATRLELYRGFGALPQADSPAGGKFVRMDNRN